MPVLPPGVPAEVAAALDRLIDALKRSGGANLEAVVLYGGLARSRYRPGKSDVNVVIVLREASEPTLAAIAPALHAAWREAAVEPLLLTPAELPAVANAFPTKLLDIKNHHLVLHGADPFAGLEVPREHLRLRVAQELRNLLLRLRRGYVASSDDERKSTRMLASMARPFALQLHALLQLAGNGPLSDDRSAAIFSAAAAAFGLEAAPLERLARLRHEPQTKSGVTTLFGDVLKAVARAADLVDAMQEGRP